MDIALLAVDGCGANNHFLCLTCVFVLESSIMYLIYHKMLKHLEEGVFV